MKKKTKREPQVDKPTWDEIRKLRRHLTLERRTRLDLARELEETLQRSRAADQSLDETLQRTISERDALRTRLVGLISLIHETGGGLAALAQKLVDV